MAILGATSGDTGSAAIAGVRGRPNIDCFILYPRGSTFIIDRSRMKFTVMAIYFYFLKIFIKFHFLKHPKRL